MLFIRVQHIRKGNFKQAALGTLNFLNFVYLFSFYCVEMVSFSLCKRSLFYFRVINWSIKHILDFTTTKPDSAGYSIRSLFVFLNFVSLFMLYLFWCEY